MQELPKTVEEQYWENMKHYKKRRRIDYPIIAAYVGLILIAGGLSAILYAVFTSTPNL